MVRHFKEKDKVLQKLIIHFYRGNINFSLELHELDALTWDKQEDFLNSTVKCALLQKYPISQQFIKLFLKRIINYLEPRCIHDEFYVQLCSVMKHSQENKKVYYRHYIINHDLKSMVTIKETNNLVINGTTGMRTWDAAFILSDWILCNPNIFNKKNVLELGCGVGFTGITIAKFSQIQSITMTDCHHTVLDTVCDNIKINFSSILENDNNSTYERTIFKCEECVLGVMMLDWLDPNLQDVTPDILIGADIVYDPSVLQPLCNVIKSFFDKNNKLEVYIAIVIRNEDTFKSFLTKLDVNQLSYNFLQQNNSVYIDWNTEVNKCLLKISSRA